MRRKRPLTPEEERLWRQAMRDTTPLSPSQKAGKTEDPQGRASAHGPKKPHLRQSAKSHHPPPAPKSANNASPSPALHHIDRKSAQRVRRGRIEVDVRNDAESVRARLRDTGPGVSEEQLEQIFERFASDRSRTGAGTGLGLPIARAIARAHGGDLWAERSEGAGAVFVCELPRAVGSSA